MFSPLYEKFGNMEMLFGNIIQIVGNIKDLNEQDDVLYLPIYMAGLL